MGFGNTMAAAVLRSPLHRMMSNSLLVLTYEGRRSGRRYTLPLQYLRDGERLIIWAGSATSKTWWRNFEELRPVSVRLQGGERSGKAQLVEDSGQRTEYARGYLERFPYTTESGKPKLFGDRWRPTDDELAATAASTVMVAIDLD